MDDELFASIYNAVETYSTLNDVAAYFDCSKRKISDTAARIKAQYKLGKSDIFLIDRSGVQKQNLEVEFSFKEIPEPIIKSHTGKGIKRFILTSAQDATIVHEEFLSNLEAYNAYLNAGENSCEIFIAGFTYNKKLFESHDKRYGWFDERVRPYMVYERVNLGDDIVFCGEMNTLPTATTPLSGMESYTKGRWGIFPHAKVQLVSIATQKHTRAKQIMTTGACTKENYVQKKAGLKAQFHHIIGAVLVEICEDGTFFCRHLIADHTGGFQDLDRVVQDNTVTTGHRIEALICGDIHLENICPVVYETTWWNENCLIDYLKPKYQFWHDLIDFEYRNHHNIKNHHHRFMTSLDSSKTVEESVNLVGDFAKAASRDFCQTKIVQSNHDNAMYRWLEEADYRDDPANAIYFLTLQLALYKSIRDSALYGLEKNNIFKFALELIGLEFTDSFDFINQDGKGFIICGDIQCGMHGNLGANGSRGSAKQFTKMGVRTNTGHTHTPQILDGAYVAGTNSRLDLSYTQGPLSWANADIITYPNGKRTILTMNNGRWYAT